MRNLECERLMLVGRKTATDLSLADLYFKNAESLKGVLLAIIQERTESDETLDESGVENVMICLSCREKYYADNHLPLKN